MNVTTSDVSDNQATMNGGGLRNRGVMTITTTAVFTNTSPGGGGLFNLSLGDLSLTNCEVTGNLAQGHAGGIYNLGVLTIQDSAIHDNQAIGAAKIGGGIWNGGISATISSSTISGNTASGNGGGIYNDTILTLFNSTVSGNTTGQHGGGVYNQSGKLTLDNVTIAANQVDAAVGNGGGIAIKSGQFEAKNTLIGDNTDAKGDNDCFNWGQPVDSQGYNLVENPHTNCVFTSTGDRTGVDPKLGALSDNGGPTMTHELLSGSPAIDAGTCSTIAGSLVLVDQRGVARPSGAQCDIGAFEGEGGFFIYLPMVIRGD
jgi:hypothetical protein